MLCMCKDLSFNILIWNVKGKNQTIRIILSTNLNNKSFYSTKKKRFIKNGKWAIVIEKIQIHNFRFADWGVGMLWRGQKEVHEFEWPILSYLKCYDHINVKEKFE